MPISSPPDLTPPPQWPRRRVRTKKRKTNHGRLMRQLKVIAAAHPARIGSTPHRREQEKHACIAVELLAANGITTDDLPNGCAIKTAPNHVKFRFTPGAQWLLDRVHRWNHRGVTWGELPRLAEKLFAPEQR